MHLKFLSQGVGPCASVRKKMTIRRVEVWAVLAAALAVCAVCMLVVPARRTLLVDRFPQVPPPPLQFDHMLRAMSWQRGIEQAKPGPANHRPHRVRHDGVERRSARGWCCLDSLSGQGLD